MKNSVFAATLAALLAMVSNASAADANTGSDLETFDDSRLYVSGFIGGTFIEDNAFENVVTGTNNIWSTCNSQHTTLYMHVKR